MLCTGTQVLSWNLFLRDQIQCPLCLLPFLLHLLQVLLFLPCTFFSTSSSPTPTTITLVWSLRHLVRGPSSLKYIPDTTAKALQYSSDPVIPLLRNFPWFPHQTKDNMQTWHLEASWTGHRVLSPAALSSNPMCFSVLNSTAPYWNPIPP